MSTVQVIVDLLIYAYAAFAVQSLAYKTKTPNGWLAWIPFVQFFLLIKIAKKPISWFWWIITPFILIIGSLLLYIVFKTIFGSVVVINWFLGILFGAGAIGMIASTILILIAWAKIIKILGKPIWTIILFFIPLVNLVFIGYLAFSPSVQVPVAASSSPMPPPPSPIQ